MASSFRHLYEFGPYRLDATERQLWRGEEAVHLTPKELDTLFALVRGAGRLMSKEELLKEIWPDTFVGEATLAQNVFTLRKALGETEGGKSYIETVPRRGYRFAAAVRELREGGETVETTHAHAAVGVEGFELESVAPQTQKSLAVGHNGLSTSADASDTSEETKPSNTSEVELRTATPSSNAFASDAAATSSSNTEAHVFESFQQGTQGHPVRAAVIISIVALASVVALVYFVYRFSVRPETETARVRTPAFQSMRVTRLPASGTVAETVISPDGKYFAYVSSEPGRQSAGVFIRQVGAASNMQQLVAPADETFYGGLVFSPDSLHVYYGMARPGPQPPMLYRVPVLGGPPEKILDNFNIPGPSPVTFSPDGRSIAFVRGGNGDDLSLVIADSKGGGEHTLVTRKGPALFGLPSWSPDGKTIACVYGSTEHLQSSTPYLGVTCIRRSAVQPVDSTY